MNNQVTYKGLIIIAVVAFGLYYAWVVIGGRHGKAPVVKPSEGSKIYGS